VDSQNFLNLIEKYKRGECSPGEKELLENYLESFQINPGEWNESEMGDQKMTEEKIYSQVMKNINKEKNHYITRKFFSPVLLKRAAIIIFFLVLVSGVLYTSGIFERNSVSVVWNEKVTPYGEKFTIILSDGSKVTLNADSKLKYPEQFNSSIREVYLEGEAYFEVHHRTSKPFIVHSKNLSTTVLGTKFNISAYSENKIIAVSLLEGKVKVSRSEKGKTDEIVVLKPKEKLLYNKENNISSLGVFDSLETVGWKDNIYKFENEPLGEVLSRLEKAFDVKFRLDDKSILEQNITIKFEKKSLQTVVDVIKSLTGLDYKIVKGKNNIKEVLFYKNTK
jgi:ferric-dicitrate binding protein FerR (iron transport regulator)